MGLIGWTCPPHGEEPGRNNSFDYCIHDCQKRCVTPPVLEALRTLEEENYHKGKRISVTMLTGGCKRQTVLERTEPFYLIPHKKLPTVRGTLIHALIEKGSQQLKKEGWLLEHSMELPVTTKSGSWTLTGTMDIGDVKNSEITDVKTLQEYALMKLVSGTNDGEYSDHIPDYYTKQANIYRYMAKTTGAMDATRLRLQIISFGNLILTGTNPELGFRKGYKWTKENYDIPDIPILPDSLVEHIIETEGDQWYRIMFQDEPTPVVDNEFAWLCKNCVFYKTEHCPDPDKERSGDIVSFKKEKK